MKRSKAESLLNSFVRARDEARKSAYKAIGPLASSDDRQTAERAMTHSHDAREQVLEYLMKAEYP